MESLAFLLLQQIRNRPITVDWKNLQMERKDVIEAIELTDGMLRIADRGMEKCEEDDCIVLYGAIRDSAYRIKRFLKDYIPYNQN